MGDEELNEEPTTETGLWELKTHGAKDGQHSHARDLTPASGERQGGEKAGVERKGNKGLPSPTQILWDRSQETQQEAKGILRHCTTTARLLKMGETPRTGGNRREADGLPW